MFSTCSELIPRAPIPDGRMERFMHPCRTVQKIAATREWPYIFCEQSANNLQLADRNGLPINTSIKKEKRKRGLLHIGGEIEDRTISGTTQDFCSTLHSSIAIKRFHRWIFLQRNSSFTKNLSLNPFRNYCKKKAVFDHVTKHVIPRY